MLIYSVCKFRARPDDDSDGPPTHGHTTLEIVWTAIPAVLVTAISIVSAIVLAQNGHAGSNPLVVKVTAQQFAWTFTYPNGKTYGYLTLPKGRHVKLDITAHDVIHSFWVPQLSQKQDAVPGQHNTLVDHADAPRHVPGDLHRALRPRPRADAQPRRRSSPPPTFDAGCMKSGGERRAARAGGLPAERLRQLPHVQAGGRDRQRRPRPRQPERGGGRRRTAARSPRSSRSRSSKPGRVHRSRATPDVMPHIFGTQIPPDKLKQLVQYLAQGAK